MSIMSIENNMAMGYNKQSKFQWCLLHDWHERKYTSIYKVSAFKAFFLNCAIWCLENSYFIRRNMYGYMDVIIY